MFDPQKKRYLYAMMAGFGAISMSILLFFILYRMQGIGEAIDSLVQILSPFVYGGVVAYLLRPMCNSFEAVLRRQLPDKLKRYTDLLAVIGSLVAMVLIVYALVAMIVPQVYYSVISLWSAIPSRVERFIAWAEATFGDDERMDVFFNYFNTSYSALYTEAEAWIRDTLVPQVSTLVSGVSNSMFKMLRTLYNLLIGLIVAVYVLFSRKRFSRQCTLMVRSLFSEKWADTILNEVALVDRMFGGFIDAKILDSAIIGVLCYIGCGILRMPNTLLVSVFVGVTNVIPFFGPFIGAIPSTLLILIDDPIKAVWFVVFVIILQQLDGNVIGPRIMGNRIGISGFWVMFAIIFFGGIWGVFGMVVGVPLFAVIYDLVRKFVRVGLNKKGKQELWEQYTADYPNEDLPAGAPSKDELHLTDWTAEDWKMQSKILVDHVREDSVVAKNWLVKAWGVTKVWAVKAWTVFCGWCTVCWAFICKWAAALRDKTVSCWNGIMKKVKKD